MITYRISNELYKGDISGNGAAMYGARWNSKGVRVLYTGQYISLVILESLVHLRKSDIPPNQYLLHIELPDIEHSEISNSKITENWQSQLSYTQWIGDQFILAKQSLILKVPSAVVTREYNFLINPLHSDFKKVKIEKTELLTLDQRLLP